MVLRYFEKFLNRRVCFNFHKRLIPTMFLESSCNITFPVSMWRKSPLTSPKKAVHEAIFFNVDR